MMTTAVHNPGVSRLLFAAACFAMSGIPAGSAFAQAQTGSDTMVNEQITVYPPQYTIRRTPVPDAAKHGFAVAQATSISLPITYSDLDLSTPAGVKELERRITQTATGICRELNRRFPSDLYWSVTQFEPSRRHDCVKTAVEDAMNTVMTNRQLASASP